jgi:Protein of unknown function (DUF2510)
MTTSPQPGWYADPQDPNAQRYWDGQGWTPDRQPKPTAQPMQASPPPMPPAPPPQQQPQWPPASGGPAASPVGPPPQTWPAAPPGRVGQTPSVNFGTVQGAVKQLGVTAWLLIGGFVAAFISIFLTWFTVTQNVSVEGMNMYSTTGTAGTSSAGKFMVLLPVFAGAWLAWPVFTGATMSVRRLAGLTALVGLIAALIILIWWVNGSPDNSDVNVSPGFGLLLCATAAIVLAASVVRLWMSRSKPQSVIS